MNNSDSFSDNNRYFPGGINALRQSFRTVGGHPFFCTSAQGALLRDAENKTYIDLNNAGGSVLLGHAHPEIVEAVSFQLQNGFSAGTPSETETALARELLQVTQTEVKVKFFLSESEACATAVQMARAFTGRKKVLKFSGGYHGDSLSLLKDSGAGDSLVSGLYSAGIPEEIAALTEVVAYNNLEEATEFFRHHGDQCAAVILEPVAANMGCIPAEHSFISGLRKLCDTAGSLLIFDESKTGIRLAFGGAEEIYHVTPDLRIFGNVVANGFPLGVLLGRHEVMEILMPCGNVYAEGNSLGNSLAYSAALATLEHIRKTPGFYEQLNQNADKLAFELGGILNEKRILHRLNQKGSMMSLFFQVKSVSCFLEALESNISLFNSFFHHLLRNGIFLPPNGLLSWFVSAALSEEEIARILEVTHQFRYD